MTITIERPSPLLDKEAMQIRLNAAEWHVVQSTAAVARLRGAVDELRGTKRGATAISQLLADLEATLVLFVADRDRLAAELAGSSIGLA